MNTLKEKLETLETEIDISRMTQDIQKHCKKQEDKNKEKTIYNEEFINSILEQGLSNFKIPSTISTISINDLVKDHVCLSLSLSSIEKEKITNKLEHLNKIIHS
jgi:hypothetical protein